MVRKKDVIVGFMAVFLLTAMLFTIRATSTATRSTGPAYDPWADVSGPTPGVPDGIIDMMDLGYEASLYLASGTPMDRANILSLAYDSGWLNITDKAGQFFNVTHNLGTTDVMVDIQGKTAPNGGVHQRYLGLTGKTPGWSKTYVETGFENLWAMVQTADGGYALAGWAWSSEDGDDGWLVKTDASGNVQWSKTYGGTNQDELWALVQTADGGYALAGSTESFGVGGSDGWLVKTDASGNMQWNNTYGGENFWAMVQTADGGYALGGYTTSLDDGSSDFWLVKTDASGNMQWDKTYGGINNDEMWALMQTADGGYALAGSTQPISTGSSARDGWLVKTDASGNAQWNNTYGGTNFDELYAMVQTAGGGYTLMGATKSFGAGGSDGWLVKIDASGNMQWSKTYGGTGSDLLKAMVQTADGGYALAGATWSFGVGGSDGWLVKTDASGNMQWNNTYGGTSSDYLYALVQTADGGYALAGYTTSGPGDAWLVKTDAESGLAWVDSSANTVTLYRGATDIYWNFVRVQIWTHN